MTSSMRRHFVRWFAGIAQSKINRSAATETSPRDDDDDGSMTLQPGPPAARLLELPISPVNKCVYFEPAFFNFSCVIHRPPGFGKTRFLEQLSAFCDIHSDADFDETHFPDIQSQYKRHLVLSFDLSKFDVLPASRDFTEEDFYSRFEEFVTRTFRDWAMKYHTELDPVFDVNEMDLLEMCALLPYRCRYTTIILIDAYDTPLMRAPPEHVAHVEATIGDVLGMHVLVAFGYDKYPVLGCILAMGVGHYRGLETIARFRGLEDYSNHVEFASAIGFTEGEIRGLIERADVASTKRDSLLRDIMDNCHVSLQSTSVLLLLSSQSDNGDVAWHGFLATTPPLHLRRSSFAHLDSPSTDLIANGPLIPSMPLETDREVEFESDTSQSRYWSSSSSPSSLGHLRRERACLHLQLLRQTTPWHLKIPGFFKFGGNLSNSSLNPNDHSTTKSIAVASCGQRQSEHNNYTSLTSIIVGLYPTQPSPLNSLKSHIFQTQVQLNSFRQALLTGKKLVRKKEEQRVAQVIANCGERGFGSRAREFGSDVV
ncbi:hypothetical protein GYMLUDRAFT_250078 [Collybiopsis luxurians FD-317 M1]|uniref:Unplaced genomic scaffold GYMLUscaffold_76, whole genome shotgun sequence n=1 Tax=Collybiopsis luxurians FD-317 M1 TaxID=944289 RepID=A0A0D0C753_9AGAR|nr:hypothetical protein GYMLUDRAFT_250078 [Collybiopsis luxurians FD-317 M1]